MAQENLMQAGFAYVSEFWKTRDRRLLQRAVERFESIRVKDIDKDLAARSRIGLGESYLLQGSANRAYQAYSAAVALEPKHPYLAGAAEYGVACALYSKRWWANAEQAFEDFLAARPGSTLLEKDEQWKAIRPGYAELSASDLDAATALSGLDLIPGAAFWHASSLFRQGRYHEAHMEADAIVRDFPNLKTLARVLELRSESLPAGSSQEK